MRTASSKAPEPREHPKPEPGAYSAKAILGHWTSPRGFRSPPAGSAKAMSGRGGENIELASGP